MSSERQPKDEIRARIKPTLDKVAVKGLRAWLKAIGLSNAAYTRAAITDLITSEIVEGRLAEAALEKALIGFEEASDMRVYLFDLDELPKEDVAKWLPNRLLSAGFAISNERRFAGQRPRPMSPIYALLEGRLLRVKWAEQHQHLRLDERTGKVLTEDVDRRIVLIADLHAKVAELRMNPPETRHAYEDPSGRTPADRYYQAYKGKVAEVLGCTLVAREWRPVIRKLVAEESPRVVRIHIDNHTNQRNTKAKTHSQRLDIRDDEDWRDNYLRRGDSWAWDSQSFYWLPKVSSGFLTRELYSHIDAEEGYVKVNADCSDEEVDYVVSQIRTR